MLPRTVLLALPLLAVAAPTVRADAPNVLWLKKQTCEGVTYFRVAVSLPAAFAAPKFDDPATPEGRKRQLARLPRLVPQDNHTSEVRTDYVPDSHVTWTQLEFVGRVHKGGEAKLLLVYPVEKKRRDGAPPSLAPQFDRLGWDDAVLTLDFDKAKRDDVRDDWLRDHWAKAEANHFANLAEQTPDFAFYDFARMAITRKYDVFVRSRAPADNVPREQEHRRLYEQTTGASALSESLAMRRLLHNDRDEGKRTVSVDKIRGIDIAEHPWKKMIGDKKPDIDPLAKLVPNDNYYITFKSVRSFIEFGELLDQWGTNVLRAYELTSRDSQIKQRYEKQLCLKSTGLAKTLGPALIREVAVTGSDLYVREGSDVTVIFHVKDVKLFLAAVNGYIDEARKEFGDELKEGKTTYKDEAIESYTTPLREVSLHRAAVGSFVIYSNSLAGLQRVLDARAGRRANLADSLDFQYMRTVFARDDKAEDGFAFLSDPFLREMVGPRGKIKEKRRLEALASLNLVTHGALFTAWDTGKLPKDHGALMKASGLKNAEIYTPEGDGVVWDGKSQVAVSDAYGTVRFLTPLVELPIDKVTRREADDYEEFRRGYLNLWRRYFDPVGMRVSLGEKQVKVETYILPLIQSEGYAQLRDLTGDGTTSLDLNAIGPKSVFMYMTHIAPHYRSGMIFGGEGKALGDWMMLRFDDSRVYRRLAETWVRRDLEVLDWREVDTLRDMLDLPMTIGVKIGDQKEFDKVLKELGDAVHNYLGPCKVEVLKPDYKGVKITRVAFTKDSGFAREMNPEKTPEEKRFAPTYWHAQVDGAWYLSMSEAALREQIDRSVARRDGKGPPKGETITFNSTMYLSPEAAFHANDALQAFLEWETHKRAVANGPYWLALYHGGVLDAKASTAECNAAALKFYGFIPVSPDDAPYDYDRRVADVVNRRHGSLARPVLHDKLDGQSSVQQFITDLRSVRVDLRFREDGVHTTLTLDRKKVEK
jgi:hypothetical protein